MFNPLMTPPQLIAAAEKLNAAFSPSPLVVLAAPVGGHPRLAGLGEAPDCHPKNAHFENIRVRFFSPGCGSQLSGGLVKGRPMNSVRLSQLDWTQTKLIITG